MLMICNKQEPYVKSSQYFSRLNKFFCELKIEWHEFSQFVEHVVVDNTK